MEQSVIQSLFFILLAALLGGTLVHFIKLPLLIGYILAGVLCRVILPFSVQNTESFTQIGLILLLFSIGLELSLSKLMHVGKVAILGAIIQMLVTSIVFYFLLSLLKFEPQTALIFSFSLSSTALVVKILEDRSETESLQGRIMIAWLLVQDLAVIPFMALLPVLSASSTSWFLAVTLSLVKSISVLFAIYIIGKKLAPFFVHHIATRNSRELTMLGGVSFALGTAYLVSLVGISPALGAFLAGVVISETVENHAIFSETRPLRELFVIFLFVSLGFLIPLDILNTNLFLIIIIVISILIIKLVVIFVTLLCFGYKGKVAISTTLGLLQIGEFALVIFLSSVNEGLLTPNQTSLGIVCVLITLVLTGPIFSLAIPLWRFLKKTLRSQSKLYQLLISNHKLHSLSEQLSNHIIICGFGRVGKWVGRVLTAMNIPFVVIDYNQDVIGSLQKQNTPVIYGDSAEQNILDQANLKNARAIVVTIPDRLTQEEVISYAQTVAPNASIFARAHNDNDAKILARFNIERIIQPEFEGAVTIVKEILRTQGKSLKEIKERIKALRTAHTKNTFK